MKKNLWLCAMSCLLALTGCTSFEDIKQQADAGNADMQYKAAVMLMNGDGTEVNLQAAEKYLMAALKAKNQYAAQHIVKDIHNNKQGDQSKLLMEAYDILFAEKGYDNQEKLEILAAYPENMLQYIIDLDKNGYGPSAVAVKKYTLANIAKCPLRSHYIRKYTQRIKTLKTAFEKAEEKRTAEENRRIQEEKRKQEEIRKAEEKRIAEEKFDSGKLAFEKIKNYDNSILNEKNPTAAISLKEKIALINQAQQYFVFAMQQGHQQAASSIVDMLLYKNHPSLKAVIQFKDESDLMIAAHKTIPKQLWKIGNFAEYTYYLEKHGFSKSAKQLKEMMCKTWPKRYVEGAIRSQYSQTKTFESRWNNAIKKQEAKAKRVAEEKAAKNKRIAEMKAAEEKLKNPKFKYPHSAISAKHIKLYKDFDSGIGFKWFEQDFKVKTKNNYSPSMNLYYNLAGAISYTRTDIPGVTFVFGRDVRTPQNLLQCNNGPLFACSFSLNNATLTINDLLNKFKKEYSGVKHQQNKKIENEVNKRISGTILQIRTMRFTDILDSEDVKIIITHRNIATRFSEGARKLQPEEKSAIELSLAYMKNQFKGFTIEIIDKKLAKHFAEIEKQTNKLIEQQRLQEKKKAAEKALDF